MGEKMQSNFARLIISKIMNKQFQSLVRLIERIKLSPSPDSDRCFGDAG
jgi:hypothetical protein